MSKRLDHLLHQNTIWSKTVNAFQLTFTPYDPNNIRSALTSIGVLIQNGKRRTAANHAVFSQGNSSIQRASLFTRLLSQQSRTTIQTDGEHSPNQRLSPRSFSSPRKPLKYASQTSVVDKSDDDIQPAILLDTSDDFCAVCRCGGELVCCDECPRVYHIDCHVPSLNEVSMNDKWRCSLCTSAAPSLKRKHEGDEQATDSKLPAVEREICEKLILQMYVHPASVPFHHPVPADVRPVDSEETKQLDCLP